MNTARASGWSLDRGRFRDKHILIGFASVTLGLAAFLAALAALQDARSFLCPADALIVGSTRAWSVFSTVPWLVAGLSAGFLLANLGLYLRSARARQITGSRLAEGFRQTMGATAIVTTGILALAAWMSVCGVFAGFCADVRGISFKPNPWSEPVFYRWNDVRRITVACLGRRRSASATFKLTMGDGTDIDLYDIPGSFRQGYPSIRELIKNVPYDDRQAWSNCALIGDFPRP